MKIPTPLIFLAVILLSVGLLTQIGPFFIWMGKQEVRHNLAKNVKLMSDLDVPNNTNISKLHYNIDGAFEPRTVLELELTPEQKKSVLAQIKKSPRWELSSRPNGTRPHICMEYEEFEKYLSPEGLSAEEEVNQRYQVLEKLQIYDLNYKEKGVNRWGKFCGYKNFIWLDMSLP